MMGINAGPFSRVLLKIRPPRRMYLDMLVLPFSLWLALVFRYEMLWPVVFVKYPWFLLTSPALAIPVFTRFGVYRSVPVYAGTKTFYSIIKASILHTILLFLVAFIAITPPISVSVFAIYWFVSITLVGGSRILLRSFLSWLKRNKHSPDNVVIYGAGSAGVELADVLQMGHEYVPVAFVDDKQELQGSEIRGIRVWQINKLYELIQKFKVKQVLLAIPSAQRSRRQAILDYLENFPVHIRTVPALADIASGRSKIQELREIEIEDILGREQIPPDPSLLSASVTGKSVMVTGAGGSIGSELCRQIIKLRPSFLVLFEASEFALYSIDRELREYCACEGVQLKEVDIVPILGTVTNESKVKLVLDSFSVQTVYHAAAYKHVPLVEHNPIEGVKNNIFGTWKTAKAVLDGNVDTFVFVSTDKAVRPTNIMGATKRLAELVVQALAREFGNTRFSIVRFGNVLGSSGSVVPLFRRQIQNGGPITLTHPEMTRYFMTIPEAAQLVIQAGAMSRGGEVFVLDMGKPVRIADLARRMISLSGLTVCDVNNPVGDISIETTSPRPGEKLYEELLLGNNVTNTEHSRIMRANEMELPLERVLNILKQLEDACSSNDVVEVRKHLKDCIEGYSPHKDIEDFLWLATRREPAINHGVVNY